MTPNTSHGPRLHGARIRTFLRWCCHPLTLSRIVDPVLADFQREAQCTGADPMHRA